MEQNPIHGLRYISPAPRTISESNTKDEEALNQIPKIYSHLQTRS